MRILIITERFGDLIPTGVITERLSQELRSLGHEIAVVSSQRIGKKWEFGPHIICNTKTIIPGRILLRISNIFEKNIISWKWRQRLYKSAMNLIEEFKPELIYARSTPVSVCEVAAKIKKETGIRTLMHFTDPVPEPIEWDPNLGYRKRMIATMEKILPLADMISFGNEAMMKYQQSLLNYRFTDKTFISPDPGPSCEPYYGEFLKKEYVELVYLGSIYGNRNPKPLFEAIERLNSRGIKCKLNIYDINRIGVRTSENVEFVGRTNDVKKALLRADILVNLDGDDKIPVFISSKLKDYFYCYRPILSITPHNSPSRELTDKCSTIFNAENNINEIENSILSIINKKFSKSDFNDRLELIQKFNPKTIAAEIDQELKR